jgi:hypothetical protein
MKGGILVLTGECDAKKGEEFPGEVIVGSAAAGSASVIHDPPSILR